MLSKDDLPHEIRTARTIIRRARQTDFPQLLAWPHYPWPYEWANLTDPPAESGKVGP